MRSAIPASAGDGKERGSAPSIGSAAGGNATAVFSAKYEAALEQVGHDGDALCVFQNLFGMPLSGADMISCRTAPHDQDGRRCFAARSAQAMLVMLRIPLTVTSFFIEFHIFLPMRSVNCLLCAFLAHKVIQRSRMAGRSLSNIARDGGQFSAQLSAWVSGSGLPAFKLSVFQLPRSENPDRRPTQAGSGARGE